MRAEKKEKYVLSMGQGSQRLKKKKKLTHTKRPKRTRRALMRKEKVLEIDA
jgi:hypothetical protein